MRASSHRGAMGGYRMAEQLSPPLASKHRLAHIASCFELALPQTRFSDVAENVKRWPRESTTTTVQTTHWPLHDERGWCRVAVRCGRGGLSGGGGCGLCRSRGASVHGSTVHHALARGVDAHAAVGRRAASWVHARGPGSQAGQGAYGAAAGTPCSQRDESSACRAGQAAFGVPAVERGVGGPLCSWVPCNGWVSLEGLRGSAGVRPVEMCTRALS